MKFPIAPGILLAFAACSTPAREPPTLEQPAALRYPFHLPDYPQLPEFRLNQHVRIEGDRMVVCRVLTNVGTVVATVTPLLPEGDSYEQFGTYIFDADGNIWRDMSVGHAPWSLRPLPTTEGEDPPTLSLEPNRSFHNCERISMPRNLALFTLVSGYHPAGPVTFEDGRQVREGVVLSNTCLVRNRSQVVCSP